MLDEIRPSTLTLPEIKPEGIETVFEFFVRRFPRIDREIWHARFSSGKVWSASGEMDTLTVYRALEEVHYRREVAQEPVVRTDYSTIWEDDDLLVIDKPPNLPVTPGGLWARHCLLHLLEQATGNCELAPLHRIDRLTSGVVVFSKRQETRANLSALFQCGAPIEKTYSAVCETGTKRPIEYAALEHHITRCPERFWLQKIIPDKPANARSVIELIAVASERALYRVTPSTGRQHQIRVQLAAIGLPIVGDPLYGSEPCKDPDNRGRRMGLDAYRLTVTNFSMQQTGKTLTNTWTSSRSPESMLRSAMARG